jgi:hypothetical protein
MVEIRKFNHGLTQINTRLKQDRQDYQDKKENSTFQVLNYPIYPVYPVKICVYLCESVVEFPKIFY